MTDETKEEGVVPGTNGQTVNGAHHRINILVLRVLAVVLITGVSGLVALGIASWFSVAADPQGTNAAREDVRTVVTYVLGVFSGIVQARVLGQIGAK